MDEKITFPNEIPATIVEVMSPDMIYVTSAVFSFHWDVTPKPESQQALREWFVESLECPD